MSDTRSLSERLANELANGDASLTRGSTISSIPTPSEDLSSLTRTVRALKAALDVMTGSGSSVLDKALTPRDMLKEGTFQFSPSTGLSVGVTTVNSISGGSGSGGGSGYVDPRPTMTTPPQPTGFSATGLFRTVLLRWNPPGYANHAYMEVWRYTSDNIAAATANSGNMLGQPDANVFEDTTATASVAYYYWIRGVTTAGTPGPFTSSIAPAGPLLIGGTDFGPQVVEAAALKDGSVTAAKILANQIDATKFASNVEPITLIPSGGVPSTKSTTQIYVVSTGKLYRWTGAAYESSVDAVDLTGTINPARIAAGTLDATKFATTIEPVTLVTSVPGSKSTSTIFNTATGKLYRWTGSAYSLSLQDFADLSGTIANTQISAGTITTNKLTASWLTAGAISAGAISTAELATNAVTAGKILAGEINTDHMVANTIDGDRILANSLAAGKITAASITATQLAAGAVTTEKLVVRQGPGLNLCPDPTYLDPGAWTTAPWGSVHTSATDSNYGNCFLSAGGQTSVRLRRRFPVVPGRRYKLSVRVWRSADSTGYLFLRVDKANVQTSDYVTGPTGEGYPIEAKQPPITTWTSYSGEWVADTSWASPMLLTNFASSGGVYYATDLRFEEMVGGDVIVDGAIVAGKIAANAIVAGSGVIGTGVIQNAMIEDGTIQNAKIATLDAAKINTGTLDAGRIAAGSLHADRITGGTIGAAQIATGLLQADNAITRGLTVRDTSGNILLSSGIGLPIGYIPAAAQNSNISIGADGALSGGGGGQVTISGLGYTGAPNATFGAPAGTRVGSTLAETVESNASTALANANSALTSRLAKAGADTLTGPISLNAATAILVGTTADGLYLGSTGIVGRKGNVTTFAVDQAGNATFAGVLSAATGSFAGSLSAATGTFIGTVQVGSSPTVSGSTMTGTGAVLNPGGTFAFGTASKNLSFDGTTLTANGISIVAAQFDSFSASITGSWPSYSVSVSGGRPGYQYVWIIQQSTGVLIGSVYMAGGITSASCTTGFEPGNGAGSGTGTLTVLVKDSNGRTTYASHSFTYSSTGSGGGGTSE